MSTITIGTAPDSWGVWFPEDPEQVPPGRFLDEVVEAGYEWIELGPYGYGDPAELKEPLDSQGWACWQDGVRAPPPPRLWDAVGPR